MTPNLPRKALVRDEQVCFDFRWLDWEGNPFTSSPFNDIDSWHPHFGHGFLVRLLTNGTRYIEFGINGKIESRTVQNLGWINVYQRDSNENDPSKTDASLSL